MSGDGHGLAAPESLRICTETSAECPSRETATGCARLISPVAVRAARKCFPNARNRGESTLYRLEVTTITSCFSLATAPGNAAASLARNAIAAAISLGCPNRRIGTLLK